MEAFLAIEKILHFHHTTSRQPLRLAQLRLRCFQNGSPVSSDDVRQILQVWPEAYKVYMSRGNQVIEAPDLPHNVDQRRLKFARLWAEKENLPLAANKSYDVVKSSEMAKREPLKHITKPVLMGRLKKEPVNRSLNLLDRIRAKEAKLKQDRVPAALQRNRDLFLRSQVPKIKRVLEELANVRGSVSLEMHEMMDILRTNLFKLGDDEIQRVLQLIIETYPALYSIVTVGSATHVKLQKQPAVIC